MQNARLHSAPDGIEVVIPTDERAWHQARGQDVTASVAAGLMGVHPYTSPYRLWAEKTGRMARSERETAAMRRGTLLEPVAVQVLAEERPSWEVHYLADRAYYRDPAARIGATPDVFAKRPDIAGLGIVQIKTVSHEAYRENWLDPDTGDVVPPLWIVIQAIIEARLTGASWASVGALIWNRDALDMPVVDVPVHDRVFAAVRRRVEEFWAFVETGEEMDPDWGQDGKIVLSVFGDSVAERVDLSPIDGIDTLLERYRAAGETIAAAKRERDALKPQIIYALGNAEAGRSPAFDVSAPTVRKAAHEVAETQYRTLRIKPRRNV